MYKDRSRSFYRTSLLLAIGMILLSFNAHAQVVNLTANLDSAQETSALDPATPAAAAAGNATMRFDTDSNQLSWNITFNSLSGPAVAAHFHGPAGFGQAAGVQVNVGDISGLQSPMTGSATLTDEQENELLNGLWYINIHTALNPPGEIRGQSVRVQAGASAAVLPTLAQWSMITLMMLLFLFSALRLRHPG